MKLRTKLLLWTLPIGIVSLSFFELLSFQLARKEIVKSIVENTEQTSRSIQTHIRQLLSSVEGQFALLSEFRPFEQYTNYKFYNLKEEAALAKQGIEQMFNRLRQQSDGTKSIAFFDELGNLVASSGNIDDPEKLRTLAVSDPMWKNEISLSTPQGSIQSAQGAWLRFSKKLKTSNSQSGRLVMEIYLSSLFSVLKNDLPLPKRAVYLLDNSGNLFFTNDSTHEVLLRNNERFLKTLSQNENSIIDLPEGASGWFTVAPRRIEGVDWRVGQIAERDNAFEVVKRLQIIGGILLSIAIALKIAFLAFLSHKVTKPIGHFLEMLSAVGENRVQDLEKLSKRDHESREIKLISDSILKMAKDLQHYQELKVQERLMEQASQVAHDIRSPIAALGMVVSTLSNIPEDKRITIRGSLARIKDIANNLLEKSKQKNPTSHINDKHAIEATKNDEEPYSNQLLSSAVDVLVSEKRMQYRSRLGLEIETILEADSYGLFSHIQLNGFKRILSNLIDNSVDSVKERGQIKVTIVPKQGFVVVSVLDNGSGIPSEILPKLAAKGFSYGKKSGNGLGLYHAKTTITKWGGDLQIESEVGNGTCIELFLTREEPPGWFVPEIKLSQNMTVVVLDDDCSIHQIWKDRFDNSTIVEAGIKLVHLSTAAEALAWHKEHNKNGEDNALYLFDYELLGETHTGLSLIEKLQIQDRAILVTSRYEEIPIREKCTKLCTRVIPKGLAEFVPITIEFIAKADSGLIQLTVERSEESHV